MIEEIRQAGQAAIGEYEKLLRDRRTTAEAIAATAQRVSEIVSENGARVYDRIEPFVEALTALRRVRGEAISLHELKHADAERIDELETRVAEQTAQISERTVAFLVDERSLEPYRQRADAFDAKIAEQATVLDARALGEDVADAAAALELLIEVVGNLEMDDATLRTAIIDRVSAIFATINAARSTLRARTSELGQAEGAAEFASQIKLVEQSVTNYLDLCDTPESTDQYQTRVMIQLEELEGKFSEFDAFVVELVEKRDEVVRAFDARRVSLLEQRNRRAQSMAEAADRVLAGVKSRVDRMESVNEINSYLAGDLMVDKARDLIDRLRNLGDPVKADDVQSRLNTIREEAVRQLKDRQDLQADGVNTIRFGRHVFSVNTQPVELTTAVRGGDLQLHLTGTRFYETVDDPELIEARAYWNRPLVSESDTVYRGEYLAYRMLREVESLPADEREAVMHESEDERLARVQAYMAPRYREGYVKGVHDRDATLIFTQLLDLSAKVGLLRYPTRPRALASAYWQASAGRDDRRELEHQLQGFGRVVATFPHAGKQPVYIAELARRIDTFAKGFACFDGVSIELAAKYLFAELVRAINPASPHEFVVGPEATDLSHAFLTHLRATKSLNAYQESVDALADLGPRYVLIRDWVEAYAKSASDETMLAFVDETAAILLEGTHRPNVSRLIDVSVRREIEGLVGDHTVIEQGQVTIDYHAMISKLDRFVTHEVPAFELFQAAKKRVVEAAAVRMRVHEFEPRVLSSFVRNRLVDQVFLPLIGDNLAKQMGTADTNTRTDRMGLLLLISPPGYGKTTLMEYIAARLGVVFIKVNGPALGHGVTSLDPHEAPNAAAREEVNKLNLAFEMGDNVVIYVDDIQHTNPEFLQRFISLCDGTRRIEGVYRGQTRTYDLRGRKVAVVMAGNPYTESGEKFRLPDMLTNRADTYNL
ncbi:MAG: ATP-binding protein, partial [Actinomycetota bacterium]